MPKETKTIRQTVSLSAAPEDVYDALIDPKKHSEFTGEPATCDPKVGGAFSAWDEYITGKNLVLERGKRIVQEWKTSEWPEGYGPSILELTLKKNGKETLLTMVQSEVPAEQVEEYRQGWVDNYWEPLEEYLHRESSI
jgi:activator of HSP90 ATPase